MASRARTRGRRFTLRYCDPGVIDNEPDIDDGRLGLRYKVEDSGEECLTGSVVRYSSVL